MRSALAAITLFVAACGAPEAPPGPTPTPTPTVELLPLPHPVDRDPRPEVLSVELTASIQAVELGDGRAPELWTYGGTVPGPILRVTRGSTILVDFVNHLPAPTTIHWHGLRVPNVEDGVVLFEVAPIAPGERHRYTLNTPDAGLFWYHPHVDSAAQLGFGLYGALLVDDPDEAPVAEDEVVMVLSDLSLDAAGKLDDPQNGGDLATLFGREGTPVLVNGHVRPTLAAQVGRRQRWRVVNAARSRYFWLELPGQRWWRIGADGGLADAPVALDRLLVLPGERADVIVEPQVEGEVPLRWVPYDRGFGSTEFRDPETILRYVVAPGERAPTGELPALPAAPPPRIEARTATVVSLSLTQAAAGTPFYLGINGIPGDQAAPIHAHIGDTYELDIDNAMEWDHPFHLHGFFFEQIDDAGQPATPRVLLDTLNVPKKERRRLRVYFDDRPGMWMFHCHILDHADAGMMGMFMLTAPHD